MLKEIFASDHVLLDRIDSEECQCGTEISILLEEFIKYNSHRSSSLMCVTFTISELFDHQVAVWLWYYSLKRLTCRYYLISPIYCNHRNPLNIRYSSMIAFVFSSIHLGIASFLRNNTITRQPLGDRIVH